MNDLVGGRYQIIKKIGSGGMAIVYLAKDLSLDRNVAIKVLRDEYTEDATFRRHFQKEAVAIAKLSHNNIVGIYDIITEGDSMCLVMEYIEGETLKDKINRDGAIPWQEAVKYSIQIANALSYAHSNQIIHKDVKSQNIIIDKNDTIKITDFGISQMMNNTTITHNKGVLGSAHYFSPEQARGEKLSYQTDIYSLGVVMYEMLVGEPPFTADNPVSVALKHIQETAKPVHLVVSEVPESLSFIVAKCLEKKPEDRFASMQALAKALSSLSSTGVKPSKTPAVATVAAGAVGVEKIVSNAQKKNVQSNSAKIPAQQELKKRNQKNKKSNKFILLAILLVVLAASLLLGQKMFPPSEQTAPDFRGLTITAAESKAASYELEIVEVGSEFSDDYSLGEIISQTPKQGSNVTKGDKISVIVSKGPENATMPNLVGSTLDEATQMLKDADLAVGEVTKVYSSEYEAGFVVSQTIASNTKLEKGTTVDLEISLGEKPMSTVPNMIGNDLSTAQTQLANANLTLGTVTYRESSDEEGTVISQGYNPGDRVDEYTSVDIVVSAGKTSTDDDDNGESNTDNNNNGNINNGGNVNNSENSNNSSNKNSGNNNTNTGSNTAVVNSNIVAAAIQESRSGNTVRVD